MGLQGSSRPSKASTTSRAMAAQVPGRTTGLTFLPLWPGSPLPNGVQLVCPAARVLAPGPCWPHSMSSVGTCLGRSGPLRLTGVYGGTVWPEPHTGRGMAHPDTQGGCPSRGPADHSQHVAGLGGVLSPVTDTSYCPPGHHGRLGVGLPEGRPRPHSPAGHCCGHARTTQPTAGPP